MRLIRFILAALALFGAPLSAQVTQPPPASGGSAGATPSYIVGNWYMPLNATGVNGAVLTSGEIHLNPFIVYKAVTVSDLGVNNSVGGSAGSIAQVAIYANSATTNRPTGTALAGCSVAVTSGSIVSCTVASGTGTGTLPAGVYWWADEPNATAGGVAKCITASQYVTSDTTWLVGTSALGRTGGKIQLAVTHTFATGVYVDMTAQTFTESANNADCMPIFKVSSVP